MLPTNQLKLFLLGTFDVQLNDKAISGFEYDKVRALLAYLAVEAGRPHRRDALIELFWPEQPDSVARKSLNQALYTLRKAVGDRRGEETPFILADNTAVRLNPSANVWIDVVEFEAQIKGIESLREEEGAETAVALYHGDFLKGLSINDSPDFDNWLAVTRERFHRQATELLDGITQIAMQRGEWQKALAYARQQVTVEPWDEEAHRQVMLILARMGDYNGAIAQYDACRTVLAVELAIEPMPKTEALYERIRAVRQQPVRHNLPATMTGFVGRKKELEQLQRLLVQPEQRLVTITGLGGMGKTRLALAAAGQQVNAFLEGVFFVSLAALETAVSLAATISAALQLPLHSQQLPEVNLLNHLRQRELLLVLDNFEHLLAEQGGALALVSRILREASEVKILVTSRERIQLPGEWVVDLSGLAYPVGETAVLDTDIASVEYEAVQLFVQSVQRLRPDYVLEGEETAVVSRICQLVEGTPLALELAAAWANVLSPAAIALEIEQSLDFLVTDSPHVSPRQRSIRAVFEASWRRLTDAERDLFAQVSVFRGGFTRTAVHQVTAASLRTLSALVNKACIQFDPAQNRYHIHELLRQYGAETLGDKQAEVEQRFAHYFQTFAETHQTEYEQLRPEWPNLTTGMRLAAEHQKWPLVLAYATALDNAWFSQARFTEMRQGLGWAEKAAVALDDPSALAKIYTRWGETCIEQSDYEEAAQLLTKSLTYFQTMSDRDGVATTKFQLARIAFEQTNYDEAEKLLQASQNIRESLNDRAGVAAILLRRARIWYENGEFDQAARLGQEATSYYKLVGDDNGRIEALRFLAFVALRQQQYLLAQSYCDEAIALTEKRKDQSQLGSMLYTLTVIHRWLQNFELAHDYGVQSLKLLQQTGRKRTEGMVLRELGFVHKEMGDYQKALQMSQQSLTIFRHVDDDLGCIYSLRDIGDILVGLNRFSQARKVWAEAKSIASALENGPLLTAIQQRLDRL